MNTRKVRGIHLSWCVKQIDTALKEPRAQSWLPLAPYSQIWKLWEAGVTDMRILRQFWEVPKCGAQLFPTRSWSWWSNGSKAAIAEVQIWGRWQMWLMKLSWPILAFSLLKTRPFLQPIPSHFLQEFLHQSIFSSYSLPSKQLIPLSLQICSNLAHC